MPKKTAPDDAYDFGSDTVRVGRHDLERLLLEFRSLVSQQAPGTWEHMGDTTCPSSGWLMLPTPPLRAARAPAGKAQTSGCAAPPPKPSTNGRRARPTKEGRRSPGTSRDTGPTPPIPPRTWPWRCAGSGGRREKGGVRAARRTAVSAGGRFSSVPTVLALRGEPGADPRCRSGWLWP